MVDENITASYRHHLVGIFVANLPVRIICTAKKKKSPHVNVIAANTPHGYALNLVKWRVTCR